MSTTSSTGYININVKDETRTKNKNTILEIESIIRFQTSTSYS